MRLPQNQLYHQIHLTYLRCLTTFRFCPDIWAAFAEYEAQFDKQRAVAVLEEAISVIPKSVLLRLACCDFYEEHEMMEQCIKEFERTARECPCSTVWVMYLEFAQRQQGTDAMRALFQRAMEMYPCWEVVAKAGENDGFF